MNQDVNSIKTFFQRFNYQKKILINLKITSDKKFFKTFFKLYEHVDRIAVKLIEGHAPKFNLFEIINIKHYEAWVHTPIIVNLLSPTGTHRQNRLFFDLFIQQLYPDVDLKTITKIEVFQEYHTAYGNLDILIQYRENGTKKAIVIENKIYAGDQQNQIFRYFSYLTQMKKLPESDFKIVYLAPTKRPPNVPYSISVELYTRLVQNYTFIEMGYRENFVPFLENTLSKVKAPVVKETLTQYIKIIKTI